MPNGRWRKTKRYPARVRSDRRAKLELLEERRVLAAPTLAPIQNVTVLAGAPLHIALDGFDADGDSLTFTATSSNPLLVPIVSSATNRSMRITVAGFGVMEFELFEDLAPRTTARIIELAQSGFYNGVTFHRIIRGFVIQGGDPTGTGAGGSTLGQFDDEFHVLLQHTSSGVLSMAKSTDDTNDSQFFITAAPTRHLDFNHSIFGFLTAGEDVRQAINAVGTQSGTPQTTVTMSNVEIFVDNQTGVLRLVAPPGATGTAVVTVTASDGKGGTATRTFNVTIAPDNVQFNNSNPFLGHIEDQTVIVNTSKTIPILAYDVEGDPVQFLASSSNPNVAVSFVQSVVQSVGQTATGQLTITPTANFVGTADITIQSRPLGGNASSSDVQVIRVTVTTPGAPASIELLTDTGASDSDDITRLNNSAGNPLKFKVDGVIDGATVTLFADGVEIGQGVASGGSVEITTNQTQTLADGVRSITASQSVGGVSGAMSNAFNITIDSTAPVITSTAPASVAAGGAYAYPLTIDANDQSGPFVYSLVSKPAGMEINPNTGLITWTPHAGQSGTQNATVRVTDLAGNFADQTFSVAVENSAPTLDEIADQQVDEFEELVLDLAANDPNLPADQLIFSLVSGPEGATIDAATGVLRWTPGETHGGSTTQIVVRVTDAGGLTSERTFAVEVDEVFQAPVLAPIGPKNARVNEPFTFQATAEDSDIPGSGLTFSLDDGAPAGATIDPQTGVFTWTPSPDDEFKTFTITVRVTDGEGLDDFETFTIAVNAPPKINPIASLTIDEGTTAIFGVTATHSLPISFALEPGAPAGASIDAATGVFTWTTNEAHGPGVYSISVRVTDSAGLSDVATFTVTVDEVNLPPTISAVSDAFVTPGGVVSFTIAASDLDLPANSLTFELISGPTEGVTLDPQTGLFTWSPPADTPEGVYTFTVRVVDNGDGALSAVQTFTVRVTNIGFALFGIDDSASAATGDELNEALLESAIDALELDGPGVASQFVPVSVYGAPRFGPDTGIQSGNVISPPEEPNDGENDLRPEDGQITQTSFNNQTGTEQRSQRRVTFRPTPVEPSAEQPTPAPTKEDAPQTNNSGAPSLAAEQVDDAFKAIGAEDTVEEVDVDEAPPVRVVETLPPPRSATGAAESKPAVATAD